VNAAAALQSAWLGGGTRLHRRPHPPHRRPYQYSHGVLPRWSCPVSPRAEPLYTPAARSARRRAAGAPPRACAAFPLVYVHLSAPHVCGTPPGAGAGPGPAHGAVDGDASGPRRRGRRPSWRTHGDSPADARAWRHHPPDTPEDPGATCPRWGLTCPRSWRVS
jgi:hypothetical protein